jgi:hypothetical protein
VSRLQTFGPKGALLSDVHVSDWQPFDAGTATNPAPVNGVTAFPRTIHIDRPHDDYLLDLQIQKITLNEEIPQERFKLEQPVGAELVHVGDDAENKQPAKESKP